MYSRVFCVFLYAIFLMKIEAGPAVDDKGHVDNMVHTHDYNTVEEALMKKLNTKCSARDISSCMMLKLVKYFDRILQKSYIEYGDFEITQTSSTEKLSADTSRSLNLENMPEEAQLGQVISDKFFSFIQSRALRWKAFNGTDVVISGNADKEGALNLGFSLRPSKSDEVVEGRRRKNNNGKDNMHMMMAAGAMKIGLLKALAFKGLVLLVGKALLISKLALVLAAVIGLKKLFSQEKHVTYEVVAHPHHEHHEHHEHLSSGGGHDSYGGGGGGWGRNFEAQNIAYKAHVPSN